jgi:hypothetical protein
MGTRIPGATGLDASSPPSPQREPGGSPAAGFADSGPIGLDAGSGAPASGTLTLVGWPRNLSWDEFRELASRPADEHEDAQIHSEVEPPSQVGVTSERGVLRVTSLRIQLRTVREDNWVVKDRKSAELLSHEQGHYDLTGLLGRDSGNEILAARASTRDELQAKVRDIIEKYREQAKTWTERYDSETDHSRNRDAQKRWDDQFRSATTSGRPFSPP